MSAIQKQQHPITATIIEQVKSIDITLPESVDDKWAEIEQAEAQLAISVAKLGLRYMDLRETVGHGEFLKALESRGICKRKVQRYMKVTQFFIEAPTSNTTTLSHLKPTQIDALASLPETEKQALTPEKIEEYGQMSVRALRAEVKQLRLQFEEQDSLAGENDRLNKRVKQLELENAHTITQLNHEQLKKAPETLYGIHAEVAHTRQKAMHIAELLATLNSELNNLVQRSCNSSIAPELAKDCALAINTSIGGHVMQLNNHMSTLQESFGSDVLNNPENIPLYSAEEVASAVSNAEVAKSSFLAAMGEL